MMPSCVWAQKAPEQRDARSGAAYHDQKSDTLKSVSLFEQMRIKMRTQFRKQPVRKGA